jgi:rod shape-determining protein MreC
MAGRRSFSSLPCFGTMLEIFRKNGYRIIAAGVLLAALLFFSLNLRHTESSNPFERTVLNVTAPAGGAVAKTNGIFSGIWEDYIALVNVRKENEELRKLVSRLSAEVIRNREAAQSNERLGRLLNLRDSVQSPSVVATIIGEDVAPWFRTMIIDRGSVDGIREGMPVVAASGVVGRIVRVAANSSRLLLVTDHASAIAATVQRSRARGVVKGKSGGICILDFSHRGEDVKVGDVIVTSGIGGVFPKGLPIGEVTMVKKGEYGIFQSVELRPYVSMSRLEEVLVLVR